MLESKGSTAGELHTSHSSFFLATTKVTINSQTNNFLNTNFKTKTTRYFKSQIHISKFRFPTLLTTFTYFSLHTSFITLDYKRDNLIFSTDFQRYNNIHLCFTTTSSALYTWNHLIFYKTRKQTTYISLVIIYITNHKIKCIFMDLGFQIWNYHIQTQIQQQINKYQQRSFLYV